MNMTQYQKLAQRTANANLEHNTRLAVAALGLTGEAGEVADHVKKAIAHGHPLPVDKVKKELGDVLWYVSEVAELIGYDLDEIAEANIDKLAARYPDGFSEYRSRNRKAGDE